jgi:hypothetical protein
MQGILRPVQMSSDIAFIICYMHRLRRCLVANWFASYPRWRGVVCERISSLEGYCCCCCGGGGGCCCCCLLLLLLLFLAAATGTSSTLIIPVYIILTSQYYITSAARTTSSACNCALEGR